MKKPLLCLSQASFRLGDRVIFSNSTWQFCAGEQWAIVGGNGSGKSLFGDAIAGKLPLIAGSLEHHFRPKEGLSGDELIWHVSFEERKQDVHDTVLQSRWNSLEEDGSLSVSAFLSYERVMDINPYEVRADAAMLQARFATRRNRAIRATQIQPLLERALLSLSNGESQRVRIARALCRPLGLLILDEPFVGLDSVMRKRMAALVASLSRSGLPLLLITSRVDDLPKTATHLLCVEHCTVVAAGRREALKRHPVLLALTSMAVPAATLVRKKPSPPRPKAKRGRELVRLTNVTVRYGSQVILRNINWTVHAGENWALLGPNGSGKTTLLSLLAGDHPQAYNNDVRVFGRRRGAGESIWSLKKRIGAVSPELQVHFKDETSCLDAVLSGFHDSIGLYERPTATQVRAALKWLKVFGMADCAEQPLLALSPGWQRMVLLARALVKEPHLLILDEPCQGLDPSHRKEFLRHLERLLRDGRVTAIYVTHHVEEIPSAINHTLRLAHGSALVEH